MEPCYCSASHPSVASLSMQNNHDTWLWPEHTQPISLLWSVSPLNLPSSFPLHGSHLSIPSAETVFPPMF